MHLEKLKLHINLIRKPFEMNCSKWVKLNLRFWYQDFCYFAHICKVAEMVALWGYIGNKRNHSLSIKHSCWLLLNFCQGKNSSNAQKELKKKKKFCLQSFPDTPTHTHTPHHTETARDRERETERERERERERAYHWRWKRQVLRRRTNISSQ